MLQYTYQVDGVGTLLLPSGDSLQNVTRVHIHKTTGQQYLKDMVSYDSLRVFVDSICPFNADSIAWHLRAMGNPILKIHTNGLLPLLLASLALPVSAQVSSENYVQTTQRISDTQVLTTTQYYDGLGRPFEKVEQRVTPSGDNLIHLQQYDGLGRDMQDGNLRKQGQWLFFQYYGKKGRVVQSHSSNLLGGWEHTYSSYTYAGSAQQTKHVHTTNGKQDVVEEYDYAYDHVGRLVKTTYCVNGSDKRDLSVVDYDNYGRILLENIMGKDEVLYDYNAQNMLTDSGYNEGDRQNDGQGNYDESLSYDKMGNVQSLLRSGLLDDGSYGLIDNLSYNYHGNQLLKVDDAAVGPYYQGAFHFVDGADEAVEYEYDANGNLVRDLNKGIISISYDLNNQPRKIEYNDGRNVSYLYDAEGSKLSVSYNLTAMSSAQPQMPVMQSSNVASANMSNGQKTIDYCGNIIYDGDETMILNDVGYALCDKDHTLSFHYYLKDHLGNNRVVVSEDGEIEQVNDYYPTGALMASSMGGDTQRFKYNGKELDRVNGLNWYDYGARNYDAEIVVWKGVDKMADKNVTTSLYGYCNSNPMRFIDPLGTDTVDLLPSPQQDYRSYTLKLDAKYFDDDPNVINVWGHGDNDGIDYNGKTLSSARDFDEMLKEHSEVWKNHAQGNPAIIVLHSCSTADFAKILSASDLFRNVLIIGPTENVKVSFYKSKLIKYDRKSGYAFYKGHYENTKVETVSRWGKVKSGIWIGYRNGKYYNSYDGGEKTRYQSDEKPGGKGFEYRTLWDRIKSCF